MVISPYISDNLRVYFLTGANADIPFVWGTESGPYLQAVHLSFCVGAILAPLATEPFLAKKICVFHSNNTGSNSTAYLNILEGTCINHTRFKFVLHWRAAKSYSSLFKCTV